MVAPAIIGGGLSLLGGIFGSKGAKKAANAQIEMGNKGLAEMARQFDLGRSDTAPWREAGASALGRMTAMQTPGYDHKTSPGYQFRFGEGQRAVESSASARGSLFSGGTLKDLVRFGDGVASQDFGDDFNRNASIAAGGQQVVQQGVQVGAQYGRDAAGVYGDMGRARASGYAGQNAAMQGTLGNLAYLFGGFGK